MTDRKDHDRIEAIGVPYGRPDLNVILQKNWLLGLAVSVVIHLATVSSYYVISYFSETDEAPTVAVRILKYSELGPPPSIAPVPLPPAASVAAAVKPSIGIPVPVPDAEVSPERTIATQLEMSSTPSPSLDEMSEGSGEIKITPDITIDAEDDPGIDEFIPVEKLPQIVKKVVPKYPEMAIRAGLEGVVWVKILVEKDGRAKKAVVVKSTSEIFNESATEAAVQFVFTPAVMNQGPVKVWVSIPFKFRLKDTTPS